MSKIQFSGLTDEEVLQNRLKYGSNAAVQKKENRFLKLLKDIFLEPMVLILILISGIYFIIGEYGNGIIMATAIIFVAAISVFQENKSRKAIEALKTLSAPKAKVYRNGNLIEISSEELVINDLMLVEDGDLVPADAEIIDLNDFLINESILTGESLSVEKNKKPEKTDTLTESEAQGFRIFQGTLVVTGRCVARIFAIGNGTALGKIGESINTIESVRTPLQEQIEAFVKSLIGFGVVAFLVVWGLNYYLTRQILHSLLHGLTLAMSVLPEEIPVAFSTFMALGAYRLYQKQVIARSPTIIETLGSANVICTDKTGTLTENRMVISAIYLHSESVTIDLTAGQSGENQVLEFAMWASEAQPFDAMEKAIHQLYGSTFKADQRPDFEIYKEYPLAGNPPLMTHVYQNKSNKNHPTFIASKGSLEGILKQCGLSKDAESAVFAIHDTMTAKGYRVLGVAGANQVGTLPDIQEDCKLEFYGLIAFYDPPKANTSEIIRSFYNAGIRVIMITGDHSGTAAAIASQIGLKVENGILTGQEVMEANEAILKEKVKSVSLFTRMFPQAKLRVIEALKSNGDVVAMTGDGVNDGPALKSAHIGIAMGMHGSEIARQASNLVLADDNMQHMVEAVALGRRIHENLKKAIRYIISIHIPIILVVTLPLILFWEFTDIFTPIHVIFLELIMGPTCSIIFENEPTERNAMKRPPEKPGKSFFSLRELSLSIVQGLVITGICLGYGFITMKQGASVTETRTIIFITLIFSNIFLTLENRSFYYSALTSIGNKNRLIPIILSISFIVMMLALYFEPVRMVFQLTSLDFKTLMTCIFMAFTGVFWLELHKLYLRKTTNTAP
jgi:Ca2+-transporting ATPase